jgi:hypothetical protein
MLPSRHSTKAYATVSSASLQLAHTDDMLVKVTNHDLPSSVPINTNDADSAKPTLNDNLS